VVVCCVPWWWVKRNKTARFVRTTLRLKNSFIVIISVAHVRPVVLFLCGFVPVQRGRHFKLKYTAVPVHNCLQVMCRFTIYKGQPTTLESILIMPKYGLLSQSRDASCNYLTSTTVAYIIFFYSTTLHISALYA
jgi:hypothetical protein